jgi:hypothetical protein
MSSTTVSISLRMTVPSPPWNHKVAGVALVGSLRSKLENSGELPNRDTSGTDCDVSSRAAWCNGADPPVDRAVADLASGKMCIHTMTWEKLG